MKSSLSPNRLSYTQVVTNSGKGSEVSGVTLGHSDSKQDQRSGPWHRGETQMRARTRWTLSWLVKRGSPMIPEHLNYWTRNWFWLGRELLRRELLSYCNETNTPVITHLP